MELTLEKKRKYKEASHHISRKKKSHKAKKHKVTKHIKKVKKHSKYSSSDTDSSDSSSDSDSNTDSEIKKVKKRSTSKKSLEKRHKRKAKSDSSVSSDTSTEDSDSVTKDKNKSKIKKAKRKQISKRTSDGKKSSKKAKHKKHKKHNKEKVRKLEGKTPKQEEIIFPKIVINEKEIGPSLSEISKSMAPMTKEEWEKQQSVIRRVYDPETGRNRLIRGDGEIIEEIVSKERHKEINKTATINDGEYFKKQMGVL